MMYFYLLLLIYFLAGLWECASEPGLLQPLFCRPQQAKVHLSFVKNWISLISPEVLEVYKNLII